MNYTQIAIMFLQGTIVAFVILLLFRLRRRLGIGALFACLGMFQFMQVFLASTLFTLVAENVLVSSGATVMFTATLFALLIIYIKEDASETKKIIYALLIVNIVMSILLESFSWNFEDVSNNNPFNVSNNLFSNHAWVLLVGTIALFLDAIWIIIIYEFLAKHIRFLFVQICLTMLLVLCFDTLFFSILAFWNFENLNIIITSGLIVKSVFAIYYSILFYFYLMYFDSHGNDNKHFKLMDVFQPLTYRQKFETATADIKKAEEIIEIKEIHYKNLTNISPVGIFKTRSDGYTTFVNKRWCEISGVLQYEALGWGWQSAVHPDDNPKIKQEWDLALAEKRKSKSNYRFVMNDGTVKWVLGQVVPEFNSQNELLGFVGTITDISDLKFFEEELKLLRNKADQSNRLKSAFLANMSHEIRTPMNGILGFTSLLKEPNLTGELQNSYIEIIEKSGRRMLNIINDIISISKIESGSVELNIQDLNINEQQQYLHTFFKPEAAAKKIELSYTDSLPFESSIIKTDQDKFISIYTNLIKNAIKYTENGSIAFGYHIQGELLEFYVRDTGIGIDNNRQEAIFERFIQADIEDKMASQGAGLGLAITKAYLKMLDGEIWVESEKGKGSTFYFTIPKNKKRVTMKEPEDFYQESVDKNQFKGLNILLAEDDDISALLIEIMLKNSNCTITRAKNGIEAVEHCQNNPNLDLVLMDVKMPLMDGYEATRQIREFNKQLIIVAQTAYSLSDDKENSFKVGCNEHLSKPIIRDELISIFTNYFSP